jgi:uncharacterized protein
MPTTEEVFTAISDGNCTRLDDLLRDDPTLAGARDASGLSAVRAAHYTGQPELANRLLAAGPDLDMFDAAAVGDADRLRVLLDERPDDVNTVSGDGFTALHLASFYGHPRAAELLLGRGADPEAVALNGSRLRPLNSAAAAGHETIAHLLLDHGADVDPRQAGGFSPLHSAARNGDRDMVILLLDRGADPGATADNGRTVADLAAPHPDVLALL